MKIRFLASKHVAKPSLWGCTLYLFGLKKPKRMPLSSLTQPVYEIWAYAGYNWKIMIKIRLSAQL